LKFARDREAYRARMRAKLRELELSLLDYCLTCNHVHLVGGFGAGVLATGHEEPGEVRKNLEAVLPERIERDGLKQEPCWTKSLAVVGSAAFAERIQPLILSRRETDIVEEEGRRALRGRAQRKPPQENGISNCQPSPLSFRR
jgi:hypothetical protein